MPPSLVVAKEDSFEAAAAIAMVTRDWRIAIHKSGHCVAARLLRLPGCGGATMPHGFADAQAVFPSNHGWRSICAMMAGSAAETILFGDHDRFGGGWDRERARQRLEALGYQALGYSADAETFDHCSQALWSYTIKRLRPYRTAIVRLAIALRRARVLDGGEIDRMVIRDSRMRW